MVLHPAKDLWAIGQAAFHKLLRLTLFLMKYGVSHDQSQRTYPILEVSCPCEQHDAGKGRTTRAGTNNEQSNAMPGKRDAVQEPVNSTIVTDPLEPQQPPAHQAGTLQVTKASREFGPDQEYLSHYTQLVATLIQET